MPHPSPAHPAAQHPGTGGPASQTGLDADARWLRRAPFAVLIAVVAYVVFQTVCSILGLIISIGLDPGVIRIKDGTFALQPVVFLFIGALPLVAATVILVVCHRWLVGLPVGALVAESGRFRWVRFGTACAIAAVLTAIGLSIALSLRRGALVTGGRTVNGEFAEIGLNVGPTYGWVIAALVAGLVRTVAEELFFRGMLLRTVRALIPVRVLGPIIAAVVSAAAFGLWAGIGQTLGITGRDVPYWPLFVGYFVVGLSLSALATLTRGLEATLAFSLIAGTAPLVAASLTERIGSSFSRGFGVDWASFALLTLGAPLLAAALWGADRIAERVGGRARSGQAPAAAAAAARTSRAPGAPGAPGTSAPTTPTAPPTPAPPAQAPGAPAPPKRVRSEIPPSPHSHRGPHLL